MIRRNLFFLIGRPLSAAPEPLVSLSDGSACQHHLLAALTQSFWKQWRSEYFFMLCALTKWTTNKKYSEVGDIVILEKPLSSSQMWPLGRITSVYSGEDGIVWQAAVRTTEGVFDHPAIKLYRLARFWMNPDVLWSIMKGLNFFSWEPRWWLLWVTISMHVVGALF